MNHNRLETAFRRRRYIHALGMGTALCALSLPAAGQAQVADEPATAQSQTGFETIVVTANRREENQQDVPIAITAISPERLEQQGINDEQDLQASVPSLVVGQNGQGSRDSQSFTLRGQGATFQASPGVVNYFNEVPLPAGITLSQQGGPGNFIDLENLQILSGPQGTLFGRNTTGGAALFVPRKPTNELGGWAKVELGNYDRTYLEGALNIPIIDDKLMIRAVAAYHDRDGYTRDVVFNKDRDDEHWYSGRLGIMFRPNDLIQNYTLIYGSDSSNNGAGFIHRKFNIAGLKGVGFCTDPGDPVSPVPGSVPCDVYREVTDQAKDRGKRKTAFSSDIFSDTETWGIHNTTDFKISDQFTLRNILSYQRLRLDYAYDSDGTYLQQHDVDANETPPPGTVTLPVIDLPVTYFNAFDSGRPRDDLGQWTEELQLQGSLLDDQLELTLGGFFFDQRPESRQAGGVILYCPAGVTGFCPSGYGEYSSKQTSKALYIQGALDMGAFSESLADLRITAGFRHTWDDISGRSAGFARDGLGGATCNSTGFVTTEDDALEDCVYTAELKSDASTWLIGADYRITPDIMVYGKVSRGYKSGGFNLQSVFPDTRTFEPETVTSYEIGAKTEFDLGNVPVRLNVSAYKLDYKDIQRAGADFNPDSGAGGAVIRNADATIKGIELDATIRLFEGVTIGGNFSHTDAEYDKYEFVTPTDRVDCSGQVLADNKVDLSCLPFQYVSPYIWSVNASIERPVGDNMGVLAFFVSYSNTSKQYTDPGTLPSEQPGAYLEGFNLINTSLDWRNVAGSNFDLGIFATNLTNELYRTSNTNVYQSGGGLLYQSTLYGEPRMYGARLKYAFGGE